MRNYHSDIFTWRMLNLIGDHPWRTISV